MRLPESQAQIRIYFDLLQYFWEETVKKKQKNKGKANGKAKNDIQRIIDKNPNYFADLDVSLSPTTGQ